MCINFNWIKNYEIKHNFFVSVFINFVRKKNENLWLINSHFTTISGHYFANYSKIFHKADVQTVILRCLHSWIIAMLWQNKWFCINFWLFVDFRRNKNYKDQTRNRWVNFYILSNLYVQKSSSHMFYQNYFLAFCMVIQFLMQVVL